ncbi:armadillo-type protein [Entophlyctis helioformis]|nr:armadillo-type protein [Entophlyctis helioformis]
MDSVQVKQLNVKGGSNRFKFSSFNDRIELIKVDAIHRVVKQADANDDVESYFRDAMLEWAELNCTTHFTLFTREITPITGSLSQILYHKTQICAIIQRHLAVPGSLAIQPILSLVTALAKDLQDVLYPHFPALFERIAAWWAAPPARNSRGILQHHGVPVQVSFDAAAKGHRGTFSLLIPVFRHPKLFVRTFAAESFGFLLRKIHDSKRQREAFAFILNSLFEHNSREYQESISLVFFETIKQVKSAFHSKSPVILQNTLELSIELSIKHNNDSPVQMAQRLLIITGHYGTRETMSGLWEVVTALVDSTADRLARAEPSDRPALFSSLTHATSLMTVWVGLRKGSRIDKHETLFAVSTKLCTVVINSQDAPHQTRLAFVKLFAALLEVSGLEHALLCAKASLEAFCRASDTELVFTFFGILAARSYKYFAKFILAYVFGYVQHVWSSDPERCMLFLATIFANGIENMMESVPQALKDNRGLLRFAATDIFNNKQAVPVAASKGFTVDIPGAIVDYIGAASFSKHASQKKQDAAQVSLLFSSIMATAYVSTSELDVTSVLEKLIQTVFAEIESQKTTTAAIVYTKGPLHGDRNEVLKSLIGAALSSLSWRARRTDSPLTALWPLVMGKLLAVAGTNTALLDGIATFVEAVASNGGSEADDLLSQTALVPVFEQLEANIGSVLAPIRLHTLRILSTFKQIPLRPVKDVSLHGPCPILQTCLDLERLPNTVEMSREKIIHLRRIDTLVGSRTLPPLYDTVAVRFLCALFSVNFAPLWPEATKSLVVVANTDPSSFWAVVSKHFRFISTDAKDLEKPSFHFVASDAALLKSDGSAAGSTPSHSTAASSAPNAFGKNSFECPNLNSFAKAWSETRVRYVAPSVYLAYTFAELVTPSQPRIDTTNIYCLLIRTLGELPSMIEKHSKEIVPGFLAMFHDEFEASTGVFEPLDEVDKTITDVEAGSADEQAEDAQGAAADDEATDVPTSRVADAEADAGDLATRHARVTILEYLAMFAKARKPAKLARADELFKVLNQLLANGDAKLQLRSLECILAWKYPGVTAYAENLKSLVQDDKFRDHLSSLDIEQIRASVKTVDQPMLMEVIARILYGKLISKRGRNASNPAFYIVDLMLEPFGAILAQPDQPSGAGESAALAIVDSLPYPALSSPKKQVGFLSVLEDLIKQLRSLVVPFLPQILKTILYLCHYAEKVLQEAVRDQAQGVSLIQGHEVTQYREVRLHCIKRLALLFSITVDFDFSPYLPTLFTSYIDHRLPKFHTENTQAPSALLDLIVAWSKNVKYVMYLTAYNASLVPAVLSLLSAKKVQDSVIAAVLSIIESIQDLHLQRADGGILQASLLPHMSHLLHALEHALAASLESSYNRTGRPARLVGDNIPTRIIRILSRLSPFVVESHNAEALVGMMTPFLKRPTKAVPESTKSEILQILGDFLPLLPSMQAVHVTSSAYFLTVCQLFATLSTREARAKLLFVFRQLAGFDLEMLSVVADLLDETNAYSAKRMDEPDFDRRFGAFSRLNEDLHAKLSPHQWRPILYNLVFFTQDQEEYSIRTSAAYGIQRFVGQAAAHSTEDTAVTTLTTSPTAAHRDLSHMDLVLYLVLPAIKRGVHQPAVTVRQEFASLLGLLVQTFPTLPQFSDMVSLLASGDDEANFFSNIYHLQMHRRQRALRRLADVCDAGEISSGNVSNIFLPLVSHFIFETDRVQDHNVVNDAIACLGSCASALKWSHYFALVKRFLNLIPRRTELEKVLIRLRSTPEEEEEDDEAGGAKVDLVIGPDTSSNDAAANVAAADTGDGTSMDTTQDGVPAAQPAMAESESQQSEPLHVKIHRDLSMRLLPGLQKLLSLKDDESVPIRIPLAVAVAKVLKQFPQESMKVHLPKLLMTLCNILSSHMQATRDATRETLVKIAVMLGSAYMSFIVAELRSALKRGYQLHVLGYTLHAIMVAVVPTVSPGELDTCAKSIVDVCVSDIFGETGKEREVIELKGKMREIRTTQSFDTIELLVKVLGFKHINTVLLPVKELLLETDNSKVVQQVEHVLRRVSVGINANPSVSMVDFMKFVHALVNENLPLLQVEKTQKKQATNAEITYTIQLKRTAGVEPLKYFQANAHLFVEFGMSLLLASLKRDRINLRNKEHLQMLDPLVDVLGRSLYSKHTTVTIVAIRVLSVIVQTPLPALKDALPVVLKRILQTVSKATSTSSELVQSCFRLLTIILRDCPEVAVTERSIIALAALVQPDLEEPERQTTTFSLIRAIIGRKIVVKEIYDLMDVVVRLLVTSQSDQVRELSRQAYMQFLLDYPHGHARFRKQMTYMIKNLEYEHETGRASILEVLNLAVTKFADTIVAEYAEMLFLALVVTLVNDASANCRRMSALLIGALLKRLDVQGAEKSLALVDKCRPVVGLVVQAFGERSRRWIPAMVAHLASSLAEVVAELDELMEAAAEAADGGDLDAEEAKVSVLWELGYYSLNTFVQICTVLPEMLDSRTPESATIWECTSRLLLHPHQWIRSLTAKLLGVLFARVDPETRCMRGSNSRGVESAHPLIADLAAIKRLAGRCCGQLDSPLVTDDLAKQVVKNLFFMARCIALEEKTSTAATTGEAEAEGEGAGDAVLEDEDANDTLVKGTAQQSTLLWLVQRLSYLARMDASKKRGPILRRSVFQLFAAMSPLLPPLPAGRPYFLAMINTLYRISKDETAKGPGAEELRQLAPEVMEILQKQVGTTPYLDMYNHVHLKVMDVRRERRAHKSIQAVADPEASAKRRVQKNDMKREGRKRKSQEQSMQRLKYRDSKKSRFGA